MKNHSHLVKTTVSMLLLVFVFGMIPFSLAEAADALPSPNIGNTLPAIHISIRMEDIEYSDWQGVTVSLDNTAAEYQFEDVEADIRGRGNSTWSLDKKPFRIRFKEARSMLDAGHTARTWTFLADHSDKSLMRNYSAYGLASKLDGMYTAPYGRHVNVYFDGVYQGVYLMSIQVSEVREGRVNVAYNTDPALCEYLIEMDDRAPSDGVLDVDYVTVGGNHYAISFPSDDKLTPAHVRYVKNYLTTVDNAISARDSSVFSLIDLPSFIDYYIIQELYKNVDIGFSSVFMQIRGQGESRRLEMGPVWDFDVSAGNAYHVDYSPIGIWVAEKNQWYKGLSDMPEFYDAMVSRWNAVKNNQIKATIADIKSTANRFKAEYQKNFSARWDILRVPILFNPPEMTSFKNHQEYVTYLTKYLETRTAWLDRCFNITDPTPANLAQGGATEWVRWGNNWYYLTADRKKATGWTRLDEKWYYFNTDGTMATGWLEADDAWYYFDFDGIMAVNETLTIGGTAYDFDANGKCVLE